MRGAVLGTIQGRQSRVCACGTCVEHVVIRYAVRRLVGGIAQGVVYEPRPHRASCGRPCGRALPPGEKPAVERHHLEGCQRCAVERGREHRACPSCNLWMRGVHSCPEPYVCRECGDETRATHAPETRARMEAERLCFLCLFWWEKLALRESPAVVRADGCHYVLGEESPRVPKAARGFGGRPAVITYLDGTRRMSTNVWHQGVIPEHFRTRLPDNAILTWVDELAIEVAGG